MYIASSFLVEDSIYSLLLTIFSILFVESMTKIDEPEYFTTYSESVGKHLRNILPYNTTDMTLKYRDDVNKAKGTNVSASFRRVYQDYLDLTLVSHKLMELLHCNTIKVWIHPKIKNPSLLIHWEST